MLLILNNLSRRLVLLLFMGKILKKIICGFHGLQKPYNRHDPFNLDGPDGYDYYWHALGTFEPVLSRRAMEEGM